MNKIIASLAATSLAAALALPAQADTIKIGLSVPLSGAAAAWGLGSEWACKKAASEIDAAGGVQVDGTSYDFECIAYDNKYSAAEGTKVAQTMLNRDGVNFIGGVIGTAPFQALQSLSERRGDLLFTSSWSSSTKGPDYPLTFTQVNTPREILPAMVQYISQSHPEAKTVAILATNDATGKETEPETKKSWEGAGLTVSTTDFYDRGTTDFQPIALRLASKSPDVVDLGAMPPADAGLVFKELHAMGWDGIKVWGAGTGVEDIMATGGDGVNGVVMGLAVPFDSPDLPDHLKQVNAEATKDLGQSLNAIHIAFYDTVYAIKAGIEAAGSIDPQKVANALRSASFDTVYGGKASFGGKSVYGIAQQVQLPIFVTQVEDGKLTQVDRIAPSEK